MHNPSSPATTQRRAQARSARDAFPAMGVYAIRNHRTGAVCVKSSRNVPGAINRLRFELRHGSHRNAELQALWRAQGEAGVSVDVLELVRERDDPAFDYDAELALLEALHRDELLPRGAP